MIDHWPSDWPNGAPHTNVSLRKEPTAPDAPNVSCPVIGARPALGASPQRSVHPHSRFSGRRTRFQPHPARHHERTCDPQDEPPTSQTGLPRTAEGCHHVLRPGAT